LSQELREMESSAQIAFDKVPPNVRKFAIGGGYMRYAYCDEGKLDLVVGRDHEHQHAHFFAEEGKLCIQITNQLEKDRAKKYKRIDLIAVTQMLEDLKQYFFQNLERITLSDSRYAGKDVVLTTFPRVELDHVKRRKAYFILLTEEMLCKFNEIDLNRFQIGIVMEPDGTELGLILTRGGGIASISASKLEEMESEIEEPFRVKCSNWGILNCCQFYDGRNL
jgi:hypothetical protein